MPARKPELEMIPHFAAVSMAPASPLKEEVILHAQRIMAVRMHMLDMVLEAGSAAVARAGQYMRELVNRPAPAPTPEPGAPVRRDPNAVSMAQCNRAVALGMKVIHDMDRLREAAYRRTGQRVGPLFWSDTGADLPQELTAPRPQPEPAPEPTTETAPTQESVPAVQAPAAESIAAETAGGPLTKRLIKLGQERMDRHGLPRRVQVDLAQRARQQRWSREKFNAEVNAALAATA